MIRKVSKIRRGNIAKANRRPELVISVVSLLVSTATALFIAFYQISHTEDAEKNKTTSAIREALYDLYVCMKKENFENYRGESQTRCTSDEVRKLAFRHDGPIDLSSDRTVSQIYRRYTDDLVLFAAISVATNFEEASDGTSLLKSLDNVEKYFNRINAQHAAFITALSLCNFTKINEMEIQFEDALILLPEQMPFPSGRITSAFSFRKHHPVLGTLIEHPGIDFGGLEGTPIRAAISGTISFVGTDGRYGTAIEVKSSTNERVRTYYAQLQRVADGKSVGTTVSAGDVIGYLGQSGLATGPHLHYEWRVGNKQLSPPLLTQRQILELYRQIPRSTVPTDAQTLQKLIMPN